MRSRYSVAPTEDLRGLCIRKNWFTSGTCEQYMKMFDMNKEKRPLGEIALAIWLCTEDVSREEVQKELESLHEDYLLMLGEMQQAEDERAVDGFTRRRENMVKNLTQLKRALVKGAEFEIVAHVRWECVGQRRRVNVVDRTGFYSIIPDKPDSRETLANNGRGAYLDWGKASFWKFENGICTLYDSDESFTPKHIIISIKVE